MDSGGDCGGGHDGGHGCDASGHDSGPDMIVVYDADTGTYTRQPRPQAPFTWVDAITAVICLSGIFGVLIFLELR